MKTEKQNDLFEANKAQTLADLREMRKNTYAEFTKTIEAVENTKNGGDLITVLLNSQRTQTEAWKRRVDL